MCLLHFQPLVILLTEGINSANETTTSSPLSNCKHPPGGATALIANAGSEKIHALGFMYVFSPVLTGVLILLLVAIVFNNATPHRQYPHNKHWYKLWKRNYKPKRRV
ncbi:CBS-domain-containing membrane protein [Pedobacter sp. CAN_A7]|uniref:HPP family protein n=1 Tax=Pedobacter sp. CAN_A7 TaxID=2787722 RepID=UPI001A2AEAB8